MQNFIVSLRTPGQPDTKNISISVENSSELFKVIREEYNNAQIIAFLQK
ncbi:hypothetical protein N9A28_01940 [Sulfurimonas sp.]|nr:hypothetical protein [Sulfurimonas sp.]